MIEAWERLLEWGGTKRDVVFLIVSSIALLTSLLVPFDWPIDPAWIAVVLCGFPIVSEADLSQNSTLRQMSLFHWRSLLL